MDDFDKKNELINLIKRDINSISHIYPTAFDLYDEPHNRLAQRITSTIIKHKDLIP